MAATTPAHHHVVDHDLDEDEEGLANGNGDTSKVILLLHPSAGKYNANVKTLV